MDYQTLMQTVEAMTDDELFLAEKKIHEERSRRAGQILGCATVVPGGAQVRIDFSGLANAVRETLRVEMSLCSESALVSVLDQISDHPKENADDAVVTQLLQAALSATLIHEARCEAERRLDSVK